jgi:zinc transport system ATP-binding protein
MPTPLISVKSVSAGYDGLTVLEDVNLDVYPTDFIGVIGPNGGGKTTLSKLLLGIIQPSGGKVLYPSGPPSIGYLPQAAQIDLSFPISVEEVILSGLTFRHSFRLRLPKEDKEKVEQLMEETGLLGLAKRPIGKLSGGQIQRVLLCRALINSPQLLVLDEPNTYVDKHFEGELYDLLKTLNEQMAILLISHDIGTISSLVKTIACVNGTLHYHPTNVLTAEVLEVYNCPIDLIAHGPVPHRVLKKHS